MIKLQMEGLERTRNDLLRISQEIKQKVWLEILYIGDTVLQRLRQEFPESSGAVFSSIKDQASLTHTIYVDNILICSVTGLSVILESEKGSAYKGKGFFETVAELQNYSNILVNQYLNEARGRIESAINIILN